MKGILHVIWVFLSSVSFFASKHETKQSKQKWNKSTNKYIFCAFHIFIMNHAVRLYTHARTQQISVAAYSSFSIEKMKQKAFSIIVCCGNIEQIDLFCLNMAHSIYSEFVEYVFVFGSR